MHVTNYHLKKTYMTLCLRLESVAFHDVLEVQWPLCNLRHYVDRTHQNLIQMTITCEVSAFCQGIFKARPHLAPQVFIMHLKVITQFPQPHTCQVIDLIETKKVVHIFSKTNEKKIWKNSKTKNSSRKDWPSTNSKQLQRVTLHIERWCFLRWGNNLGGNICSKCRNLL